jgi:hypothetical protein
MKPEITIAIKESVFVKLQGKQLNKEKEAKQKMSL